MEGHSRERRGNARIKINADEAIYMCGHNVKQSWANAKGILERSAGDDPWTMRGRCENRSIFRQSFQSFLLVGSYPFCLSFSIYMLHTIYSSIREIIIANYTRSSLLFTHLASLSFITFLLRVFYIGLPYSCIRVCVYERKYKDQGSTLIRSWCIEKVRLHCSSIATLERQRRLLRGRRWHKTDESDPGQWFVMQTNVRRSTSLSLRLLLRAERVASPRGGRRVSRNSRADRRGRRFSIITWISQTVIRKRGLTPRSETCSSAD